SDRVKILFPVAITVNTVLAPSIGSELHRASSAGGVWRAIFKPGLCLRLSSEERRRGHAAKSSTSATFPCVSAPMSMQIFLTSEMAPTQRTSPTALPGNAQVTSTPPPPSSELQDELDMNL